MLNSFINQEYLSNSKIKQLNREFSKNKPFSHLVLKDFFNPEVVEAVKKNY